MIKMRHEGPDFERDREILDLILERKGDRELVNEIRKMPLEDVVLSIGRAEHDLRDMLECRGDNCRPDRNNLYRVYDRPASSQPFSGRDPGSTRFDPSYPSTVKIEPSMRINLISRENKKRLSRWTSTGKHGIIRRFSKTILVGMAAFSLMVGFSTYNRYQKKKGDARVAEAVRPMPQSKSYQAVTVAQYLSERENLVGSSVMMTGVPIEVSYVPGDKNHPHSLSLLIGEDSNEASCSTNLKTKKGSSMYDNTLRERLAAFNSVRDIINDNKSSFPKRTIILYGSVKEEGCLLEGIKISPTESYR